MDPNKLHPDLAAIMVAGHIVALHPDLAIKHMASHRDIIVECGACNVEHDRIIVEDEWHHIAEKN